MPVNHKNVLQDASEIAAPAAAKLINNLTDAEPLGVGAEKAVYDLGNGKVVTFLAPKNAETLRRQFYTQKLAHLLLPNNIPNVHLVGSRPPLMILDKVLSGPRVDYGTFWDGNNELITRMREVGIKYIDYGGDNFIRDSLGQTHYVDSLDFGQDLSGLAKVIDSMKGSEAKRARFYASRAQIRLPGMSHR